MGIEKTIRIDNEIANRDLVDFDYLKYENYSALKQGLIEDYLNTERNDIYKFEINDIQLAVPPISIGINKESLDYAYKTLRSKSTTKIQSTNAVFHVSITLMFPRETLLQLHRLVIQIRNNPFVYIKNKYLSSSVAQNEYFEQLINASNTSLGNSQATHFTVFNLQVSNYQQSPGSFLVELDLRYFNHNAYSNNLMFKKELLYISNDTKKLSTIPVTGLIKSRVIEYEKKQDIELRFYKNEFKTEESYIEKLPTIKTIKDDFLFSKYLSEKLSTYAVDSPKESNIYVRYYNRLQAEALWNNFGINIFQDNDNGSINLFEDYGYNDITEWFSRGVDNNQSIPMKVLSISGKYLPVPIRKEIIEQMLMNDSKIEIIYESYHKLNLKSEDLKIISSLLKKGVTFNRNPDDKKIIEKNNKALVENEAFLKKRIEEIGKKKPAEINKTDKEEAAISNLINLIKLSNVNFKDLSFMQLADDFANIMSFVHREVISHDYENNEEFSLIQQIKPLAITSMSAMISNQIATIPLLGHHYPTHQYLGSTEPKYSMTFIGNSDPDSRDNMPSGIKKIEQIKNLLTYNSNNYKFVPNSNCFALNSFITRLFDSYKEEDLLEIDSKDKRVSDIKKRLSMNALNIQTIESLPGMSSGTMRISETNVYDYEKISQVYSSELKTKYEDFHKTFLKDIRSAYKSYPKMPEPPKKTKQESDIQKILSKINIKITKLQDKNTNNFYYETNEGFKYFIKDEDKIKQENKDKSDTDILIKKLINDYLLTDLVIPNGVEIDLNAALKGISSKINEMPTVNQYTLDLNNNNIGSFYDVDEVFKKKYSLLYLEESYFSKFILLQDLKNHVSKFFLWAEVSENYGVKNLNSIYLDNSSLKENLNEFFKYLKTACRQNENDEVKYSDFLPGGLIHNEEDPEKLKKFFESFKTVYYGNDNIKTIKENIDKVLYQTVNNENMAEANRYKTLYNIQLFNVEYTIIDSNSFTRVSEEEEKYQKELTQIQEASVKFNQLKKDILKFPIEIRAKIYKIISLEDILLQKLHPYPTQDEKYLNQFFSDLHPQSNIFEFSNMTLKEFSNKRAGLNYQFLQYLFTSKESLNLVNNSSTSIVSAETKNNAVIATSLVAPVLIEYGIASIVAGTGAAVSLPFLVAAGITIGSGYVINEALTYIVDKVNGAVDKESSNYLGTRAFFVNNMQDIVNLDFEKSDNQIVNFFFEQKERNDIRIIFDSLVDAEIQKEVFNFSFDKKNAITELNLKGNEKGLENIFPQIIKDFINTDFQLAMYPEIRKAFLANANTSGIILPGASIGNNEYLAGTLYSTLMGLFWFPTEVDVVLNVNDYSTLFKNTLDSNNALTGYLVNDEIFESFDLEWDLEQKYLNNFYGKRNDLFFAQRLKDTDNISRHFKDKELKKDSEGNPLTYFMQLGNENQLALIEKLNNNIINIFRFEYEKLILDLLKDEDFIQVMKVINPTKYEKLEKYEELDGIDLSGESAYPDIDLPLIPVDHNLNNKLNPGFFYFNQEEDFSDEFAKDQRIKKDIEFSLSVFKKSKQFMNAMKSKGIYSGPYSGPTLEKKQKNNTLDVTFDELLFDMRDEPNSDKVVLVNDDQSKVTQKITSNVLFESGKATITRTDTFSTRSTVNSEPAYLDATINYSETQNISVLELYGTVGQDYLSKYAEEIVKSRAYLQLQGKDPEQTQELRNEFVKKLLEQKRDEVLKSFNKQIKGNSIGDSTSRTDLFTFTNTPILVQDNKTRNLAEEKNNLVNESLKIFKGDDQYTDDAKVIEELGIQAFSDRRSIKNAYPTFKFYLVEEDVSDSSNFNVYDDFYSYNGVKDITIYKSRKLAADTAVIRLQNISGSIDGTKRNVYRDVDYEMGLANIENIEEGNATNNLGIQSVMLRAGVTGQIRLGYDSNPNNLQVMISGKVTDVMWSSNGDLCEVTIQSFGVELISKRMGTSADPKVQEIPFKDTYSLLGFVIHQSEMAHFGRFKKNAKVLEGENRDSTIGLQYSLDEMLVNSTSKSISSGFTSIGVGIAITGAITTLLLYAFRGRASNMLESVRTFMSGFMPGLRNVLTVTDDIVAAVPTTTLGRIGSLFSGIRGLLTPVWVFVAKGLTTLRVSPGSVSKSTALAEYGLFGTLLRMGNTANTLSLGYTEILVHGIIMPYFRTVTTFAILDLFGLNLVSNFIETTIRSIRYGFNNLMGYDMAREYFLDKYKTTLVKMSPADDCIYVPAKELYINTDQESRLKNPLWKNLSDYLNKSKSVLFDDTILGSLTNIFLGTTSWRFALESENSVMEKQNVNEFIKQVFLLADKRLDVIDASFYYYIQNKTSWEILNEMTLRHTGWITGARPYGLGLEYRVFFGRPNDMFFYKEYSQNTIELLNQTISWLYSKTESNYTPKPNRGKIFDNKNLLKAIPSRVKNVFKEEDSLGNYLVQNLYSKLSSRKRPFRQYHMLSSRFNLISNNVQVNETRHNSVNVKFKYKPTSDNPEGVFTRNIKLHDNIPEDKINTVDIDFSECKGFGAALRYGVSTLILETKETYDGEIICIGKPNINPHDVCILEDTYNNIYGGIEVEAVTHMFSSETGYITEIRPNMICTSNESTTYPILQSQAIFEASKRVVEELKLVPEDLKNTDILKKEISEIVDLYFDSSILSRVKDEIRGKSNFANSENHEAFVNLFSQDNAAAISVLKDVTVQLLTTAYETGDLDFLSNMRKGIAQVPESIKNSLNKITKDAAIASLIFMGLGLYIEGRFRVGPSTQTLSAFQTNLVSFFSKSKDLSIYTFAASLFTNQFGESIIENFLGHNSTFHKITDSLNETNFAKINDGTIIQLWPLFKNDKPLVANGIEYIKQNYIWHNRFGEIYNTISDAAYGYLNEREKIKSYASLYGDQTNINNLLRTSPLKTFGYYIKSRYGVSDLTVRELYTYDQLNPSGLESR
ncbi:hypothetical protein UFOVP724_160 [uncultured Caudovirales phage]|uniref:Uncharacterized protein n=1 Tax=uncultured Caudovirales phage TaxID=2100421 RepID=A0A6J5NRS2_9CAUD|nr:hypothetical protein UFOVP724_160 [uncultured Caudovirales phage]